MGTDPKTLAQIHREADALEPFAIVLDPDDTLRLAALVQLALCHPEMLPVARETGDDFLAAVRDYFRHCPTVLQVLQAGSPVRH